MSNDTINAALRRARHPRIGPQASPPAPPAPPTPPADEAYEEPEELTDEDEAILTRIWQRVTPTPVVPHAPSSPTKP